MCTRKDERYDLGHVRQRQHPVDQSNSVLDLSSNPLHLTQCRRCASADPPRHSSLSERRSTPETMRQNKCQLGPAAAVWLSAPALQPTENIAKCTLMSRPHTIPLCESHVTRHELGGRVYGQVMAIKSNSGMDETATASIAHSVGESHPLLSPHVSNHAVGREQKSKQRASCRYTHTATGYKTQRTPIAAIAPHLRTDSTTLS